MYPSASEWLTALEDTFDSLLTLGYSYNIDEDNQEIVVFNNNCQPNFDELQINVGINFEIYCNG